MQVYYGSKFAMRRANEHESEMFLGCALVRALTKEIAEGILLRSLYDSHPEAKGWSNHLVTASDLQQTLAHL